MRKAVVAPRLAVFASMASIASMLLIIACGLDIVGTETQPGADVDSGGGGGASSSSSGSSSGTTAIDGGGFCDGAPCTSTNDGGGAIFDLEVLISNGGSVTSTAGITCPPTCKVGVPSGTTVSLTAVAPVGGVLVEWGGAALGREPQSSVTVTAPTVVKADFAALIHYVHSLDRLSSVNATSGAATSVALFAGPCASDVADIALDRRGTLYAVTRTAHTLHTVDRTTATCSASLGSTLRFCNSLTFAPASDPKLDQLYAACGSDFYRIDQTNGSPTLVGGLGGTAAGDIAYLPGYGVFVTLTTGLAKVNLATGAATIVNSNPAFAGIYGLGHANGKLLGYGDNTTLAIEPTTGTFVSLQLSLASGCWGGATGP